MAHRLVSHHRAFFTPTYHAGTSAHISTSSVFRTPFDVKDEEDFNKRVMQSSKPTIVDFHAEWCQPCKALAPKLDAAIGMKQGQVELAKVDIDQNAELAMQYGVNAVPTVLGVKDGKIVNRFTGVVETKQLNDFMDKLTNN